VLAAVWTLAGAGSVAQAQTAPGIVRAAYPVFRMTLFPEGERDPGQPRFLKVEGRDGRAEVPPGRYAVLNWEVETADAKGRQWKVTGNMLPRSIEIRPEAETQVPLAAPLQAHLFSFPGAPQVLFRVTYTGAMGERVREIRVDGAEPPPPWLRIQDTSGKVIEAIQLKPGCSGTCVLAWEARPSLQGRFRASLEMKLGPFPVATGPPLEFELKGGRLFLPPPRIGNLAGDFVLLGTDAATLQLGFLRDRPVVLAFLCRCERCAAVATALSKQTVVRERAHVLAIFADPEITTTTVTDEFRAKTGFTGPILLDQTNGVTSQYEAHSAPRVFVVGRDGLIHYAGPPSGASGESIAAQVGTIIDKLGSKLP
jgi:peroxiredoxin